MPRMYNPYISVSQITIFASVEIRLARGLKIGTTKVLHFFWLKNLMKKNLFFFEKQPINGMFK